MKKLYLVRHAKSSWDDYMLSDEKRPLNERGKRDAPIMAQKLFAIDPDIELIITSPAKRAKETARVFRMTYGMGKNKLEKEARLYLASPKTILEVIRKVPEEVNSLAIFGHNPGLTEFLNRFSDGQVDNIPTCGIARIHFDVTHWQDVDQKKGILIDFYYPKMFGLL